MTRVPYLEDLGAALDTAIRPPIRDRRRRWFDPAAAVAAFLIVLGMGALMWLVRGPGETAAPPTSTSPAPTPIELALPVEWARVPSQPVFESVQSLSLVGLDRGTDGYVAVGFEMVNEAVGAAQVGSPGTRGVIVESADGVSWSDVPGPASRGALYQDLVIGARTTVLVGVGPDNDARFWIRDGDSGWSVSPVASNEDLAASVVAAVVGVGDGYVAVGQGLAGDDRDSPTTGVVWRSGDGRSWAEIVDPEIGQASLSDVTTVDGTVYAGGLSLRGDDGTSDPAVWASYDGGATWAITILPRLESGGFGGVSAVTAGPLGLFAVGFERSAGAVWRSADGAGWERIEDVEGWFGVDGSTIRLHDVIATQAGLIVTGVESRLGDHRRVTWISQDGVVWSRLVFEESGVIDGSSTIAYRLATDDEVVLAVGSETTVEGRGVGAVWISPPPPGVDAQMPLVTAPERESGHSMVVVHPDRGVSVTGVDVTVSGEPGSSSVVLVDADGVSHRRCTIEISYGQGRCTFEVGDLPAGQYEVMVSDRDVVEIPFFEVLAEGSEIMVLGVVYNTTMWPLVDAVRVENHGAEAVDVTGWSIQETKDDRFTFPDGTIVDPARSVGVIQHGRGGNTVPCPIGGPSYFHVCLDDDSQGWHGAPLELIDADGTVVDRWSR